MSIYIASGSCIYITIHSYKIWPISKKNSGITNWTSLVIKSCSNYLQSKNIETCKLL